MKKIILVAVTFISLATIMSCTNDDEVSLLGKWENFKLGTVTNGQETLTDYVPVAGCAKNFAIINSAIITSHYSMEANVLNLFQTNRIQEKVMYLLWLERVLL